MEVRNSLPDPNYAYGKQRPGPSKEGEGKKSDELQHISLSMRSALPFGDSVIVSAEDPSSRSMLSKSSIVSKEKLRRKLRFLQTGALVLSSTALLATFGLILLPLLVIVFSFGGCFIGGVDEWVDFALTLVHAARIPALVFLMGLVAFLAVSCRFYRLLQPEEDKLTAIPDSLRVLARKRR